MVPLDFYRQPTSPPATGCQDTWTRRIKDKGLEKDPDQMSNIKVDNLFHSLSYINYMSGSIWNLNLDYGLTMATKISFLFLFFFNSKIKYQDRVVVMYCCVVTGRRDAKLVCC